MKNVVKCYKHFFFFFYALKTHCDTSAQLKNLLANLIYLDAHLLTVYEGEIKCLVTVNFEEKFGFLISNFDKVQDFTVVWRLNNLLE